MKFDLPLPTDRKLHIFCITCRADGVKKTSRGHETTFVCPNGHVNVRALYYGGVKFWIAPDKELWHQSVGVFVKNKTGKFLFVDRTEFPFGLAIPAGHVDENETPPVAAARELLEEVGLVGKDLKLLFQDDIVGDGCSGGSDAHRWSVFGLELPAGQPITMNQEGRNPVWLSLAEARKLNSPFEIAYMLDRRGSEIDPSAS